VISIGLLGSGGGTADYYLTRQAGCELDYYTGAGERRGVWCGRGAASLGLAGPVDRVGEAALRTLLDGRGASGERLVPPVLRSAPRSRLPARPLLEALRGVARQRGVAIVQMLGDEHLASLYTSATAGVERDADRSIGPRTSLPADVAGQLARAAGLDPHRLYRDRHGGDGYAGAVKRLGERVDVRRAGLDLTFSAPKSVSVLYGLGDLAVASEVRAAQAAAVAEAVAYLERGAGHALRGHQGDGRRAQRIGTDGLIGATFEHRSSRAGDPQLHTHVVVANLLHGRDGQWSALDSRAIYRQSLTAGYVYQVVLRGELTRRMGVGWGPVARGVAELDGVPAALRKVFSQRRSQIEAEIAHRGQDGPAATQRACLATRPGKTRFGASAQRKRWADRAREHGYEPADLRHILNQVRQPATPDIETVAAEVLGPNGVTRQKSSFDRGELLRAVCTAMPVGASVSTAVIEQYADRLLDRREAVPLLAGSDENLCFSTAELLATEQWSIKVALNLRSVGAGCVPPLAGGTADLSAGQIAGVHQLISSGHGVEVVVGPAGAGKTVALDAARRSWEAGGHVVIGTALAAVAARRLEQGAGIRSLSLTRMLADLDQLDPASGRPAGLPENAIVVVDEAGMVGTRQLARVLAHTAAASAKLVLVGDPAQLPEIEAGGLFAALARHLDPVTLKGNLRQQAAWEQAALIQLRRGDVRAALDAYLAGGRVHVALNTERLTERIVSDYLTAADEARDTVILTSTRADARRLGDAVRQRLIDAGALGPLEAIVETEGESIGFRAGDQVVATRNDYPRELLNGTRGQVAAVHLDRGSLSLAIDDGHRIEVPIGWAAGRLEHGYAMTCHRAQGLTVDTALLYGSAALCREAGYVGMSRGRHANHVYATLDALQPDRVEDAAGIPTYQRVDVGAEEVQAALVERLCRSRAQRLALDQQPMFARALARATASDDRDMGRD